MNKLRTRTNYWITLIGLIIGAFCYWRIPYKDLDYLDINLFFLVGITTLVGFLISKFVFDQKPVKIGINIMLGVVLSVVIRILYDSILWDSTSHNLAPFELLFSVLHTLPGIIFGLILGKLYDILKK